MVALEDMIESSVPTSSPLFRVLNPDEVLIARYYAKVMEDPEDDGVPLTAKQKKAAVEYGGFVPFKGEEEGSPFGPKKGGLPTTERRATHGNKEYASVKKEAPPPSALHSSCAFSACRRGEFFGG